MIIYLASFSAQEKNYGGADKQEIKYISLGLNNRLFSNYHLGTMKDNEASFTYLTGEKMNNDSLSLFLDSGAFSAWRKGIEINIDEYIEFIKLYESNLEVYAVLDDILDPVKTWKNQAYMESKGLKPLPVFHFGEPADPWLNKCKEYDYFAIGGMVPISNRDLKPWLDKIWTELVDSDGYAKHKVHGFGLTSVEMIKRYPWHSVDSTSWVMTGRFGSVFVPVGTFNKITISDKADMSKNDHFQNLPNHDKENIIKYFENLGEGYTIQELMEDYKKRDEVNILYFINLEKEISSKPPRFLSHKQGSLF